MLHPVRREEDIALLERLAVLVAQHAAARFRRGQHAVVRAEQEQRAHCMAVVSRHLADIHRVERHRNGADAVLRQHQPEELRKLLGVEHGIAQDLHKLVHHTAENAP